MATNIPRVRYACAACLPRATRRWQGQTIRIADDIAQAVAELGRTDIKIPEWRRLQWFAA